MTPPLDSGSVCPCGSGRPFGACCERLLSGARTAATPRELMRSRYTAHALGDDAYLHRTYAPTARQPFRPGGAPGARVEWTRLVVHRDFGGPDPDTGFVEFSAFYRKGARDAEMRECSEFRRVDGQWLYVRGVS